MTSESGPVAPPVRFQAVLGSAGKTATGFIVPAEAVAALGRGRRPPVLVTIGGHSYRSTVAVYGDRYMIGVSAENRARAGVAAGDLLDVQLELDTAPREVTVPTDFAGALAADGEAGKFFDTLSYSVRQWHVLQVEGAKTAETRQRRIARSVSMLREHRAR